MITNDTELKAHFEKIRKSHWLDFDKYIQNKTKPYVLQTTPDLLKIKGLSILDIGPGPGHYTKFLKDQGHRVYGIDRTLGTDTMDAYRYLNEKWKLGHIYGGAEAFVHLENFGLPESFDIINCRGSIWHVINSFEKKNINPDEFFNRALKSLKKNGRVILSIDKPSIPKSLPYIQRQEYLEFERLEDGIFISKN